MVLGITPNTKFVYSLSWSFYRASCPFILTESDFILNPKHYFTLTALAAE